MRFSPLAFVPCLLLASAAQAAPPLPSPSAGAVPAEEGATRRGVVQVEQNGHPLAIGTVLAKDGRILTALSGLGTLAEPDIRYADGSVVKAKIAQKDKAWDLALLVPVSGKWTDGLTPTDTEPRSATSFLPKNGKLAAAPIDLKGRVDAHSKEGEPLKSALDVDTKGPVIPGAPLLDSSGHVVGILVRACKEAKDPAGPGHCTPVAIGAPVYALRGFLMKSPTPAVITAPWLGLGGVPTEPGAVKGVKVMGVAAGSPAEKAGLKAGDAADTIVAVEGQPVETPEQLAEAIAKRGVGQTVKLLVFSGGKFRDVPVGLRSAPADAGY